MLKSAWLSMPQVARQAIFFAALMAGGLLITFKAIELRYQRTQPTIAAGVTPAQDADRRPPIYSLSGWGGYSR